ncbi:helix-turn-helix domain-containing protein [soil metagenome]
MTIAFECGLDAAFAVLGGKWKPHILYQLAQGTRRYGDLKRAVGGGVSDKVLIQHLKELVEDGVIDRIDHRTVPPKVEYSLTEFGSSLASSLGPLCAWGSEHMSQIQKLVKNRERSIAAA